MYTEHKPVAIDTMICYSPITSDVRNHITAIFDSSHVIHDEEKMKEFATDASELSCMPDLVVEATSQEQIQALLKLATLHSFPVTPRGLGTGLTGGAVPVNKGVVLSLAKMNRILSIEKNNLIAVVEPGVINIDLKQAVYREGLFYPPDPASLDTCSIGGNAATNAGGPSCVKYGTTRDYILGIEAVLPNGHKIKAGVQTRKGVVGYDLLHLLIGSEGTLAVITKLILKLLPRPEGLTTLIAFFPHLAVAMKAVTAILNRGFVPCAIEFLDRRCLKLVGDLLPFEEAEKAGAFLLIELDGAFKVLKKESEKIGAICFDMGAINVLMAPDSQKRAKVWEIRKEVSLRIENNYPLYIPEDVVVPIGKIADFVACLPDYEKKYNMLIYSFGHAGDGNIHLNVTAGDQNSKQRVEKGIQDILKQVLVMGGTISGEHGIGTTKKQFLPLEISSESMNIQRKIKKIFDPGYILNPGKIFDFQPGE